MREDSVRRWSAIHAALYRLTGGLVGRRMVDNDVLLLTTKGHVTGKPHTVPLLYLRDGPNLVLIASYGGRPRHPTWYRNLVADPSVEVRVQGRTRRMRARTATDAERQTWWPRVVEAYSGYADYQSRTERTIPIVILEPFDEGGDQTRRVRRHLR
ncbi:MAG TPA: nitroreductase family deazaflavin-dependent oxidoreductase [Acidimicrobiia bacterium]|nr:nitroreductase family deazaflavin-dependent oxidoreductase [Acidimicrobiia bacterium]